MTISRSALPQLGDVVITRETEGGNAYTTSVVPGPPQVRHSTYEEAVSVATAWALREHVAIWLTEDDKTYTALGLAPQQSSASRGPMNPGPEDDS